VARILPAIRRPAPGFPSSGGFGPPKYPANRTIPLAKIVPFEYKEPTLKVVSNSLWQDG